MLMQLPVHPVEAAVEGAPSRRHCHEQGWGSVGWTLRCQSSFAGFVATVVFVNMIAVISLICAMCISAQNNLSQSEVSECFT